MRHARILLALLLAGCGAATPKPQDEPVGRPAPEAPLAAPEAPLAEPLFAALPVVNAAPYPATWFRHYGVNPTVETAEAPRSTFVVGPDTAAYAISRAWLGDGHLPDPALVRVEAFVNALPAGGDPPAGPLGVEVEIFPSPGRRGYHVLRLVLRAGASPPSPARVVAVVDLTGATGHDDRVALARRALATLAGALAPHDMLGLVGYGPDGFLEVAPGPPAAVLGHLDRLRPRPSPELGPDLDRAYALAGAGGRVLLCADGLAPTTAAAFEALVERVRAGAAADIPLAAVGLGRGHYDDARLDALARAGGGAYHHLDRPEEAGRLRSVAVAPVVRDVVGQVELNPIVVARYRLLGYENRGLPPEALTDAAAHGGELAPGSTFTVLYEVKLVNPGGLGVLRVRYRDPAGAPQALHLPLAVPVPATYEAASADGRLALLAATFAEKLRGAYWARNHSWDQLVARHAALPAPLRDRADVVELGRLIAAARALDQRADPYERLVPLARMDFDHVPVVAE